MIAATLARALLSFDRALLREAEWAPHALAMARTIAGDHTTAGKADDAEHQELARLVTTFRLSAIEREIVIAALAPELDERYGALLAILQHDGHARRPTVGLLSRMFGRATSNAHEVPGALASDGHLVRSGLLELSGDGAKAARRVSIPDALLSRLLGEPGDGPFAIQRPTAGLSGLVLSDATRASVESALAWIRSRPPAAAVLAIEGQPGSGRDSLAAALAHELGYAALPLPAGPLDAAAVRAVVREAAWHHAAVIARPLDPPPAQGVLTALAREVSTPIILVLPAGALHELPDLAERSTVAIEVGSLELGDRTRLWSRLLGERSSELDPAVLARRFRFGPGRVRAVVRAAGMWCDARSDQLLRASDIQRASRTSSNISSGLATRLECPFSDDDIVLTPETRRELGLIVSWARHGAAAFATGGSGERIRAQIGLVCLFVGPPGTGKTMAAQLLARKLHLDMLRVDLSQVVDKYIGETEKNLERVFAEAEATGALLFFDEADALFGKRTEIKDAHDRYANLDTAFLLQRVERHPGIVVLATNLRANLDAAMFRRIQVIADFPMPSSGERLGIWNRHLVPAHLASDVDLAALAAKASLAGGDIRNASITAALLAAEESGPIHMRHLVIGTWRELRKLGRLVQPRDFGPWSDDLIAYAGASLEEPDVNQSPRANGAKRVSG
jgi:hypothetical protein